MVAARPVTQEKTRFILNDHSRMNANECSACTTSRLCNNQKLKREFDDLVEILWRSCGGVLFTAPPPHENLCHVSQAEVFVCESHRNNNNMTKTQKTFGLFKYCLDISFKRLLSLLNNEIENFPRHAGAISAYCGASVFLHQTHGSLGLGPWR